MTKIHLSARQKSIVFPALMISLIIVCLIFMGDSLALLITALMAFAVFVVIRLNRQWFMKMTRWAKANLTKTQVLIIVLQIALMILGIFEGNNLKELGYEFSDLTAYVFCVVIFIGYLSIPFLPKRNEIAIPMIVNRRRLSYTGIALSSFMLMMILGNKLENNYPNSFLSNTVEAIDSEIVGDKNLNEDIDLDEEISGAAYDKNYETVLAEETSKIAMFASYTIDDKEKITPSLSKKEMKEKLKAERKAKRFEKKKQKLLHLFAKKRLGLAAIGGGAAVLLIILLVITSCAGICLLISAFSGGGAGSGILGAIIAGASIYGIVRISKNKRRNSKTE